MVVNDDFAGSGSLSGNWTQFGQLGRTAVRNSGLCEIDDISLAGQASIAWTGNAFDADQICSVIPVDINNYLLIGARATLDSSLNGYYALTYPGGTNLYTIVAGTSTLLGSSLIPASPNVEFSILAIGSSISVTINGSTYLTVTDTTFASGGQPAVVFSQQVNNVPPTITFFEASGAIPNSGGKPTNYYAQLARQ